MKGEKYRYLLFWCQFTNHNMSVTQCKLRKTRTSAGTEDLFSKYQNHHLHPGPAFPHRNQRHHQRKNSFWYRCTLRWAIYYKDFAREWSHECRWCGWHQPLQSSDFLLLHCSWSSLIEENSAPLNHLLVSTRRFWSWFSSTSSSTKVKSASLNATSWVI